MGDFEKNIKICFVTREYAHSTMGSTGGIGVFLKQYLKHLSKYAEITVFSFGMSPNEFFDGSVKVVKIKDFSKRIERIQSEYLKSGLPGYISLKLVLAFCNRVYISFKLFKFVKNHKFNLIEYHDYGGDAAYFKNKIPYVIRCHGSAVTLHQFMGYHNRKTDTVFERFFFKRFNKNIIGVSQYAADTTKKAFHLPRQPKVIYSGVNLTEKLNHVKYTDLPTIPYSLFYFGSIRERKGIDIACKVFNQLIIKFPLASFHILGNNNNDYWNTTAKPILSSQADAATTYYGSIPNEKINDYLEKAHVVIFPSYGENFSIALMEVMALGKAVVTSQIPAFEELIIDGLNGFMVNQLKDYIDCVSSVFTSEELAGRIGSNARKTIEEHYQWNKIIPQNIKYYQSLLNA